jgi:hypothetical protein
MLGDAWRGYLLGMHPMHPITCHITAHAIPPPPKYDRQQHTKQHTTCLQPHEPLLMRWIAGGMMMPCCQDHQQGSKMAMGPNNIVIVWAPGEFLFVFFYVFIN